MTASRIHDDDLLYAHFGAAALAAQLLEQNVINAIRMKSINDEFRSLKSDLMISTGIISRENLDKQTLGRLINMFRRHFSLDKDAATMLADALQLRNSLMHGYFPRNARRMIDPQGRNEMISELDDITEALWTASKIVAPFISSEGEKLFVGDRPER